MTPLDLDLVPEPPASPAMLAARQQRALVVGLGGGRPGDSPMAKSSFAERRLRATDTVSTRHVDPMPGVDGAATRGAGPGAASPSNVRPVAVDVPGSDAAMTPMAAASAWVPDADASPGSGSEPVVSASSSVAVQGDEFDPSTCRAATLSGSSGRVTATGASSSVAAAPASANVSGLRLDDALVVPAGALMRGYLRCHALLLVGDVVGNVHCTAGPVVIRSGASLKGRLVAVGDVYVSGIVGDSGGAVITTRGKLTLAPGARVDGDVRSGWLDVYDGAILNGSAKRCED